MCRTFWRKTTFILKKFRKWRWWWWWWWWWWILMMMLMMMMMMRRRRRQNQANVSTFAESYEFLFTPPQSLQWLCHRSRQGYHQMISPPAPIQLLQHWNGAKTGQGWNCSQNDLLSMGVAHGLQHKQKAKDLFETTFCLKTLTVAVPQKEGLANT